MSDSAWAWLILGVGLLLAAPITVWWYILGPHLRRKRMERTTFTVEAGEVWHVRIHMHAKGKR